jgi:3-dehydroquinate dehydratase/shikimate dehydrogenase
LAQKVGAANTLTRRPDGAWAGDNTDVWAAADALCDKLGGPEALRGKTVLLLGAGGAGKALARGLRERGAELLVANRTRSRAEELAAAVGGRACGYEDLPAACAGVAVAAVVNTTSVGMSPQTDASPLAAAQIPPGAVVFDTVYNPLRTKLLGLAEERGCATLDGSAMFVAQGARQFEMWTGRPAPKAQLVAVVREKLNSSQRRGDAEKKRMKDKKTASLKIIKDEQRFEP